jgi:hypothetical protein
MDFKIELIKLQQHCLENRNYLLNSEGDIDKGARSVYQEIRVKIMEIMERAQAENNPTSDDSNCNTPLVIKSVCEHHYITAADWKSQTCSKCGHRINIEQTVL